MFTTSAYKAFKMTKRNPFSRCSIPQSLTVQGIQRKFLSDMSSLNNSVKKPEVGEIIMKKLWRWHPRKGSDVRYILPTENLKAIFTTDGGRVDRKVWISIGEDGPTEADYAQKWPKDKQKRVVRLLKVSKDGKFDWYSDRSCHTVYKVAEKKGTGGQRLWREVLSRNNARVDWDAHLYGWRRVD